MAKRSKKVDEAKRGKFSEAISGILDRIATTYVKELKMTPEMARRAAELAMEEIRESTGGSTLYVAKGHLFAITEKHWSIYRRFNGSNYHQLHREFELTERQIYDIVKRCREVEFERKQPSLFAGNE